MSGAGIGSLGWQDGSSQLGSYLQGGGLGWIFVTRGDRDAAASGTVWAWINAAGPYTRVLMKQAYFPAFVADFPVRAAVSGGDTCSFPSVEADALVAAGIALYA